MNLDSVRTIFRQVINAAKDIDAVADGYKTKIGHEFWLADGLQKDAIQNSWDARIDKRHGRNWECVDLNSLPVQKRNSLKTLSRD